MVNSYFSIHNHTDLGTNTALGFPDTICRVPDLIQKAYDYGLSGVSISDHESISAHIQALKYYNSMARDHPFTLALGNEIYLMEEEWDRANRDKPNTYPYYHFLLTALDTEGHKQLRELSTRAWKRAWKQGRIWRRPTYYSDLEEVISENQGHVIASTACFRENSLVITKEGKKKISEITSNDIVLTHDGTWQKVISPTNRKYNGKGRKIKFSKSTDETICTENHLFLIYDKKTKVFRWEEAKNLKIGDSCFAPIFEPDYSNLDYIDFSKELEEYRKTFLPCVHCKKINAKIKITPELIRTFGLWLADGHIRFCHESKNVGFSFHERDFNNYYQFVSCGMKQFGIKPYIHYNSKHHKYEINYNSSELAYWWFLLFGDSKARNKHIPLLLKNISSDMNKELFYGYVLGDGYFRIRTIKDKYSSTEIVTATISKQLHEDIKDICQSFGFSPSIMIAKEHTDKNKVHHNTAYYLTFSLKDLGNIMNKNNILSHSVLVETIDKYAYLSPSYFLFNDKKWLKQRVKSNNSIKLNETVYCLNVQNNHSFVCNGVIVHNCLGSYIDRLLLSDQWEKAVDECGELDRLLDIFGTGNVYLEIQPAKEKDCDQYIVNNLMWKAHTFRGVKIIPSCDSHHLSKDDAWIHKIYLQSQEGDREVDDFYATAYLMSPDELREHLRLNFSDDQIDQMFEWSNEIVERVKGYDLFHKPIIPQIPVDKLPTFTTQHWYYKWYDKYPNFAYYSQPERSKHEQYFFHQVELGLRDKVENKDKDIETYIKRLDEEFEQFRLIGEQLDTSIPCYFSSMSKIIDLIWEADSLAMPARGSSGACLTNYLLEVVQVDPVEVGEDYLPFWRFLKNLFVLNFLEMLTIRKII